MQKRKGFCCHHVASWPLVLSVMWCTGGAGDEALEGRPEQLHLALTAGPSSLSVAWVTHARGACSLARDSVVRFGGSRGQLSLQSKPGTIQRLDIARKKKKKRREAATRATLFHTAVLDGLEPGRMYFYSVGSTNSTGCWSDTHSFLMPGAGSVFSLRLVSVDRPFAIHFSAACVCARRVLNLPGICAYVQRASQSSHVRRPRQKDV
jgi:hypothetical protein